MDSYFNLWLTGRSYPCLFCYSNCSRFGHWEHLQVGFNVLFDMSLLSFEYFLALWHHNMFQARLVLVPTQPWNELSL